MPHRGLNRSQLRDLFFREGRHQIKRKRASSVCLSVFCLRFHSGEPGRGGGGEVGEGGGELADKGAVNHKGVEESAGAVERLSTGYLSRPRPLFVFSPKKFMIHVKTPFCG